MNVVVLGGGPGGYVCAIRLAQNGAHVTLVERAYLGGTCLNVGCIPTKALLHSAAIYHTAAAEAAEAGVEISSVKTNWQKVQARRKGVVNQLVGGVEGLLRANGVKVMMGEGRLTSAKTLDVVQNGTHSELTFNALVIATGSAPKMIPIPGINTPGVITSTEALSLEKRPEKLCIIGGGVIGCEFAAMYAAFGTKVTVLEALPSLLAGMDEDVVRVLTAQMKKLNVDVFTGSAVKEIKPKSGGAEVFFNDTSVEADYVLVATGRGPATKEIGLEEIGIKTDRGFIAVDRATMRTNVPGIYAIGDCNGGVQLAHAASAEGIIAADIICGLEPNVNFSAVPSCVYTFPEIGSVGLSEAQAAKQGYKVKTGAFSLAGNGKSLIEGDTSGLVKLVADAETGEVLGMHIAGPRATDMIAEGTLAINLECTVEEIASSIHPHPTVSEAIQEAAHSVFENAIHMPPRQ